MSEATIHKQFGSGDVAGFVRGSQFQSLSADEWLLRHRALSEEDYAKDPTRNRLAVLLSRINHLSHHLGQVTLALK